MAVRKPKAFTRWRILCQSPSGKGNVDIRTDGMSLRNEGSTIAIDDDGPIAPFDELVIKDPYVHAERTDARSLSVWLGNALFSLWIDRKGKTHLRLMEGTYDPVTQLIGESDWRVPGVRLEVTYDQRPTLGRKR